MNIYLAELNRRMPEGLVIEGMWQKILPANTNQQGMLLEFKANAFLNRFWVFCSQQKLNIIDSEEQLHIELAQAMQHVVLEELAKETKH